MNFKDILLIWQGTMECAVKQHYSYKANTYTLL